MCCQQGRCRTPATGSRGRRGGCWRIVARRIACSSMCRARTHGGPAPGAHWSDAIKPSEVGAVEGQYEADAVDAHPCHEGNKPTNGPWHSSRGIGEPMPEGHSCERSTSGSDPGCTSQSSQSVHTRCSRCAHAVVVRVLGSVPASCSSRSRRSSATSTMTTCRTTRSPWADSAAGRRLPALGEQLPVWNNGPTCGSNMHGRVDPALPPGRSRRNLARWANPP